MEHTNQLHFGIRVSLLAFFILLIFGCGENKQEAKENSIPLVPKIDSLKTNNNLINSKTEIAVEKPPFSDDIFPCSNCHDYITPNPRKRKLVDMHEEISAMFNHDSANRWCLDCHDLQYRDSLRLASGRRIPFDSLYLLCGQCHGDKLRDWKVGVHGKRTGYWNGQKRYLLCVHCHNPHSPRFKALKPMPPPVRQEDIKAGD